MLASRGPQGLRGYAHLGKNSRVERPRGAFSWGPDDPETMSLAMMRPGGSSVAGATREKCGARVRAPWSRKADTSVYMRMMPPGPPGPLADWAEETLSESQHWTRDLRKKKRPTAQAVRCQSVSRANISPHLHGNTA